MVASLEDAYFTLLAIQMKRKLDPIEPALTEGLRLLKEELFYSVISWHERNVQSAYVPMTKNFFLETEEMLERIQGKLNPLTQWANAFEAIDYSPSKDEILTAISSCDSIISDVNYLAARFRQLTLGRESLQYMQKFKVEIDELMHRTDKLEAFLQEQTVHMDSFM